MGKSSGGTTGFKYFMDLHFLAGLGRGGSKLTSAVKDALLAIVVGGRIAWEGEQTSNGTIQVSAPELFGGDEKEGGIEGRVEIMFGGPEQPINSYLQGIQGSPQSAYRGLFGLLVKSGHVASNNPYVKPWSMLRRRITGDWYGGDCWHESKAPIPLAGAVPGSPGAGTYRWAIKHNVYVAASPDGVDWSAAYAFTPGAGSEVNFGDYIVSTATNGDTAYANYTTPGDWTPGPNVGATAMLFCRVSVINGEVWHAKGMAGYAHASNPAGPYTLGEGRTWLVAGNADFIVRYAGPQQVFYTDGFWFYRSVEGGDTWEHVHTLELGGEGDDNYFFYLDAAASNDSRVAFGGADYGGNTKVFWSTDGFDTKHESTMPAGQSGHLRELLHVTGAVWMAFVYGGTNDDGPSAVLRSTDNLASFQTVDVGGGGTLTFGHMFQGNAAVDRATGQVIFIASLDGGGVHAYEGREGEPWQDIPLTFGPNSIYLIGPTGESTPPVGARYCMNPAHVIYQCITDPENGLGYPAAVIDEASFIKAADQLYDEGLGVNLGWNVQTSIEDFIAVAQDHAGGMMVRDRRTGLFKFKLLRKDYVIDDLPIYGPHNCRIIGDAQRPSPADVVNELQVTYTDYRDGEEKTTTVRNVAAQQAVGRIISKPHSLTGLPTESLAQRCGVRDLDAMSLPLWRLDLEFFRTAAVLEPGDVFRLIWPPLGLDTVMRVPDELNYGNAAEGRVRGKVIEDVFALPDAVWTGSVGDPNPGPSTAPLRAASTLVEAPYRDLVQVLTPAKLASLAPDAAYIGAVAVRANQSQTTFELHTRIDPAPFVRVATGDFAGSALLSADVAPLDAGLPVTGEVDLGRLEVGSAAFLGEGEGQEMVRIVSVNVGMIGVARGCGDTLPTSWPAGTRLWGYDNYGAADPTEYFAGEAVEGRAYSRSPAGLSNESVALTVTPVGRAWLPYVPGNVKSNGVLVLSGNPTIPPPPTLPTPPPGSTPGGQSANGAPASTTLGPNGGYADTGELPIPFPTATGADEIGADGDFTNPTALAAWTQQNGQPLDPAKWTTVGGRAQCDATLLNRAFYRAAEQTMPWLPFPRYVVEVSGYLQTEAGVTASIGVGRDFSSQAGGPGGGGSQSEPAEYLVETLVSYQYALALQQPSVLVNNQYLTHTIMPMIEHNGGILGGVATFKDVAMTVVPVPFAETEHFPDHLDLDEGLEGWGIFPDVAGNIFGVTASGGVVTMAPTLAYATECVVYCKTPLVGLDEVGKYAHLLAEVLSTDPSTAISTLGIAVTGGVALGLITMDENEQVIGRFFGPQERGDWTQREAFNRAFLANGTAGITLHWAARMKAAAGRVAKFRNPRLFITDDAQD